MRIDNRGAVMRTDRYTKIVLTIIAACLVWLSIGGAQLLPSARAQEPQPLAPERALKNLISGPDLAFRIDGRHGDDAPIGTLVVRINGGWYTAQQHFIDK
jgi:hypothetical protein